MITQIIYSVNTAEVVISINSLLHTLCISTIRIRQTNKQTNKQTNSSNRNRNRVNGIFSDISQSNVFNKQKQFVYSGTCFSITVRLSSVRLVMTSYNLSVIAVVCTKRNFDQSPG